MSVGEKLTPYFFAGHFRTELELGRVDTSGRKRNQRFEIAVPNAVCRSDRY